MRRPELLVPHRFFPDPVGEQVQTHHEGCDGDRRPEGGSPEAQASAAEEREAVNDLVGRLPLKYREAVVMRFYLEMAYEEMAEVLGLTLSGAKMRVHRALARLRDMYE